MGIVETVDAWIEAAIEAIIAIEDTIPGGAIMLRIRQPESLPKNFRLSDEIVRHCDSGGCHVSPEPVIAFSKSVRRFFGHKEFLFIDSRPSVSSYEELCIHLERAIESVLRVRAVSKNSERNQAEHRSAKKFSGGELMDLYHRRPETMEWTAKELHKHFLEDGFKCSESTIKNSGAWKLNMNLRAKRAEELATLPRHQCDNRAAREFQLRSQNERIESLPDE